MLVATAGSVDDGSQDNRPLHGDEFDAFGATASSDPGKTGDVLPGNRHAAKRSCGRREPDHCGSHTGNEVVEQKERVETGTRAGIDDRSRSRERTHGYVKVHDHGLGGNTARSMISSASPDRSVAGLRCMLAAASTWGLV